MQPRGYTISIMCFKKEYFLLVSFIILTNLSLFSQEDKLEKTKSVKINAKTNIKKTNPLTINSTNGFKNAYKKTQAKFKKIAEDKALNNKGILTQAQLNNLKVKEMYGARTIEKVDSHQGDFLTSSKSVTISFRDFGDVDGDKIAIFHNNIPIIKTTLHGQYQSFQIVLEKGNNKIEIYALNQGSLGANTAQYKLVNKEGFMIASQYWFLATGAKATFGVYKGE